MFSVDVETTIGQVAVQTTQNKGLSPEYWTERILERLDLLIAAVQANGGDIILDGKKVGTQIAKNSNNPVRG